MNPLDRVTDWITRSGLGTHVPVLLIRVDDRNQISTALLCIDSGEVLLKLDSYDDPKEKHVLHIKNCGKGRMQGTSDRELSASWYENEDPPEVWLELREKDENTGDFAEDPEDVYIVLPLQLLDRKFE